MVLGVGAGRDGMCQGYGSARSPPAESCDDYVFGADRGNGRQAFVTLVFGLWCLRLSSITFAVLHCSFHQLQL